MRRINRAALTRAVFKLEDGKTLGLDGNPMTHKQAAEVVRLTLVLIDGIADRGPRGLAEDIMSPVWFSYNVIMRAEIDAAIGRLCGPPKKRKAN